MKRFLRVFQLPETPHIDDGWHIETVHTTPNVSNDPGQLPMPTWHAQPVEAEPRAIDETAIIPQYRPAPHDNAVVSRIEHAYNDVDAKCKAATALLTGNLQSALEGLKAYAARNPVAV